MDTKLVKDNFDSIVQFYVNRYNAFNESQKEAGGRGFLLSIVRKIDASSVKMEDVLITGGTIEDVKADFINLVHDRLLLSISRHLDAINSPDSVSQQTAMANELAQLKEQQAKPDETMVLVRDEQIKQIKIGTLNGKKADWTNAENAKKAEAAEKNVEYVEPTEVPEFKLTEDEIKDIEKNVDDNMDQTFKSYLQTIGAQIVQFEQQLDAVEQSRDVKALFTSILRFVAGEEGGAGGTMNDFYHDARAALVENFGADLMADKKELVLKDLLIDTATSTTRGGGIDMPTADTWRMIVYLIEVEAITMDEIFKEAI